MSMVAVDAYSQIFRCFYAVSILNDSRGRPTNALLGFAKLLLQLEKSCPSGYGAMAFDCGKVAFRLEIAPEYKGNRAPTPEELLRQIPAIRDLAAAFGWPLVSAENFEADDLIAGGAKLFEEESVIVVSSDKDLAQLVSDRLSLWRPAKPSGFTEWDAAKVVEGFGVRPGQIVDYLSLLGDTADNIPGVRSVGEKTAAKILGEVGSLESFYASPDRLASEKLRALLLANRELVEKNRRLITLRRDLPPHLADRENWKRNPPEWEKVRAVCEEYELKSILKQLPTEEAPPPAGGMEQQSLF